MKKLTFILLIIISPSLFFSFTKKPEQKVVKTVIIDPGHGGKDQGASGQITTEAKICLAISLKLGKQIETEIPGVKVLYTRTSDVLPGPIQEKNAALHYRAEFANQSGADLFISIHCNAINRAGGWYVNKVVGYKTETYYTGKGKSKKKRTRKRPIYEKEYVKNITTGTETYIWAARETGSKEDHLNLEDMYGEEDSTLVAPDENDPVIKAYKLLYTKKFFNNSLKLAEFTEQEFINTGRLSRGVKQRNNIGIWVLHATGMPSMLVETGFITNTEEEQYLVSDKGQNEVAANVTNSLKNYIKWKETLQNNNTTSGNNNNNNPEQTNNSPKPAAIMPKRS